MKEHSAAIHVQVPIDVATFLLNEKRTEIYQIESRLKVAIMLIPNSHMETPHYTITRLRQDDISESPQASYNMVALPEAGEDPAKKVTQDTKVERARAVVQGITPSAPAPMRTVERRSIFGWLFGWMFAKKAPAKPATRSNSHRDREGRNAGGRNAHGNRPEGGRQRNNPRRDRDESRPAADRPAASPTRESAPRAERPPRKPPVQVEVATSEVTSQAAGVTTETENGATPRTGRQHGRHASRPSAPAKPVPSGDGSIQIETDALKRVPVTTNDSIQATGSRRRPRPLEIYDAESNNPLMQIETNAPKPIVTATNDAIQIAPTIPSHDSHAHEAQVHGAANH